MKSTSIGIVILNYNNYQITLQCLEYLYTHYDQNDLNVVIIENGSLNDSLSKIKEFFEVRKFKYSATSQGEKLNTNTSKINIISITENIGYARGNNVGINFLYQCEVDYIMILTNDIMLVENIIPQLILAIEKYPDVGLISPLLRKNDKSIDLNCCRKLPTTMQLLLNNLLFLNIRYFKQKFRKKYILLQNPELLNNELVYCDLTSGSCMLGKTETWRKINGFDEKTYLYYEEDILFHKLKNIGLKMAILPKHYAIHLGGQSTKTMINLSLLEAELASQTYYLKKYKKVNFIILYAIKFSKKAHINLLKMNNKMKSILKKTNE